MALCLRILVLRNGSGAKCLRLCTARIIKENELHPGECSSVHLRLILPQDSLIAALQSAGQPCYRPPRVAFSAAVAALRWGAFYPTRPKGQHAMENHSQSVAAANGEASQGVPDRTSGRDGTSPGDPGRSAAKQPKPRANPSVASPKRGAKRSYQAGSIDTATIRKRIAGLEFKPFGAGDEPIKATHPTLSSWLFEKSFNGKDSRQCPRITITPTTRGLRVRLTCPSEGWECEVDLRHAAQLWDVLEAECVTFGDNWRELDRGPGAVKRRENRKQKVDTRESWD